MARELPFGSECCIGNISECFSALHEAIQDDQEVVVDLGQVERIDTAGIQLLLAISKEAKSLGVTVTWRQSDTVREFASLIGVSL